MMEATLIGTFLASRLSVSLKRANAGSESILTPELRIPIARSAPALILSSLAYVNLSIVSRPTSTSPCRSIPIDAVVDSMPSSLVFQIHELLSPSTSIMLSLPNPALAKELTKALARLCLAESTLVSPVPRVSRWVL